MRDLAHGEQEAPDAEAQRARRRRRAVGASLALHGALVGLALSIPPSEVVDEPRPPVQLTTIDVELGPRPPELPQLLAAIERPGGSATPALVRAPTRAGARGRRGHAAPAAVPAQPVSDPFADLAIRYEPGDRSASRPGPGTADGGEGPGAGALGRGAGLGLGAAGPGLGAGGALRVPDAPPSRARPARAKHDYSRWPFRSPPEYGGAKILLELEVDARGEVSGVRVLQSVAPGIDERALTYARSFEFHPALDSAGEPIASAFRWEFVIEGEVDFNAALWR